MMNKDALRLRLDTLCVEEAFALAVAETPFWDVRQLQNSISPREIVLILSSRHPVEAAALLHELPPLAATLLLFYLRRFVARSGKALKTMRQWGIKPDDAQKRVDNLRRIWELSKQVAIVGAGY